MLSRCAQWICQCPLFVYQLNWKIYMHINFHCMSFSWSSADTICCVLCSCVCMRTRYLRSLLTRSLEPRLSVPDFVSQLFPVFLQSCETKSRTESLGSRLAHSGMRIWPTGVALRSPDSDARRPRRMHDPHALCVAKCAIDPRTARTTISSPQAPPQICVQ